MIHVFGEGVRHSKPSHGNFDEFFGHVALAALPQVQHHNTAWFESFARLPENRFVDFEAPLLAFIHESQWLYAEIIRFPAAEPKAHPVGQVKSGAVEKRWRSDE